MSQIPSLSSPSDIYDPFKPINQPLLPRRQSTTVYPVRPGSPLKYSINNSGESSSGSSRGEQEGRRTSRMGEGSSGSGEDSMRVRAASVDSQRTITPRNGFVPLHLSSEVSGSSLAGIARALSLEASSSRTSPSPQSSIKASSAPSGPSLSFKFPSTSRNIDSNNQEVSTTSGITRPLGSARPSPRRASTISSRATSISDHQWIIKSSPLTLKPAYSSLDVFGRPSYPAQSPNVHPRLSRSVSTPPVRTPISPPKFRNIIPTLPINDIIIPPVDPTAAAAKVSPSMGNSSLHAYHSESNLRLSSAERTLKKLLRRDSKNKLLAAAQAQKGGSPRGSPLFIEESTLGLIVDQERRRSEQYLTLSGSNNGLGLDLGIKPIPKKEPNGLPKAQKQPYIAAKPITPPRLVAKKEMWTIVATPTKIRKALKRMLTLPASLSPKSLKLSLGIATSDTFDRGLTLSPTSTILVSPTSTQIDNSIIRNSSGSTMITPDPRGLMSFKPVDKKLVRTNSLPAKACACGHECHNTTRMRNGSGSGSGSGSSMRTFNLDRAWETVRATDGRVEFGSVAGLELPDLENDSEPESSGESSPGEGSGAVGKIGDVSPRIRKEAKKGQNGQNGHKDQIAQKTQKSVKDKSKSPEGMKVAQKNGVKEGRPLNGRRFSLW